ncbi:MAG: TetR/AcrR family transcriptional regulator [Candidatus Methanomethylophilaceae archaeon]|jgi:AcrR family transcriptional regulator
MSDTHKNPEERKKEFIDVSIELFEEKGYENTSVDDIIKKMGVAKGLFYYYFKSKDEILYALVDQAVEDFAKSIDEVMSMDYDSSIERFVALLGPNEFIAERSKTIMELFRKKKNREFHNLFTKSATEYLEPAFKKTIIQGIEEGSMNTNYPAETARVAILILTDFSNKILECENCEMTKNTFTATNDILSRLLGIDLNKYTPSVNDLPPHAKSALTS